MSTSNIRGTDKSVDSDQGDPELFTGTQIKNKRGLDSVTLESLPIKNEVMPMLYEISESLRKIVKQLEMITENRTEV